MTMHAVLTVYISMKNVVNLFKKNSRYVSFFSRISDPCGSRLVGSRMPIGNKKFGIPRKYQYQFGIWYLCPNFLGIFLVFYRNHVYGFLKIW